MPTALKTATAPAPSTSPAMPPSSPWKSDSPATWPTTRRLRQPIALSVPNSRVRRPTPLTVSRMASANAAASTASDSQRPRLPTRSDAVDSDPLTEPARSSWVLTVASGSAASSAVATEGMFSAESAWM